MKSEVPIGYIEEEFRWWGSIMWIKASETECLQCDGREVDKDRYPKLYKLYKVLPNFNAEVN